MKLKALSTGLAALALGVGLAACGGSSPAPGVVTAPGDGATAPVVTTPQDISPSSGPLAKEPSFSVPTGAAPKKLVVKTLIKGTGPTVAEGDTVYVNYVGKIFKTGKVFDASWKDTPGKTFEVANVGPSAQVIKGWQQGLVGLQEGGRYMLIIPPSLAYGPKGSGSTIPGNATLVFVIDVDKVVKAG